MRGTIDLGTHKLAGVYRVPARRTKSKRMPKMPGGTKGAYRMLWRIVDGAVRDAFERHPDYLTEKGKQSALESINKRVVGALVGYGAQASQCRSVVDVAEVTRWADALGAELNAAPDAAADNAKPLSFGGLGVMALLHAIWGAGSPLRLWRATCKAARPKFWGRA